MNLTPRELMETYLLEVVAKGRVELVAHVTGFRRCISELNITIDRIVSGQNEVMAYWSFTGKHVGPWLGQAPTGQEISGAVFSFFDLADGQICHYRLWLYAMFDKPVVFDSSRSLRAGVDLQLPKT